MEMWKRAREFGAETQVPEESLVAARKKLQAVTSGERVRQEMRGRRRLYFGAGIIASVAVGIVCVIVIVQSQPPTDALVAMPTPSPSSTTSEQPSPISTPTPMSARSILSGAAHAALSVPELNAGQYLKITEQITNLAFYSPEYGVNDLGSTRLNATAAWAYQAQTEKYVPADLMNEWVWSTSEKTPLEFFGDDAQLHYNEDLATRPTHIIPDTNYRVPEGGQFLIGTWPHDGGDSTVGRLFQVLPSDPAEILDWLVQHDVESYKRAALLTKMLATNVGSPIQRWGLYTALSTLPESQLLSYDDQRATIVSTSAWYANAETPSQWDTVTIDRATGYVLERSKRLLSNPEFISDETPDERSVYSFEVVDYAP